MVEPRVNPVFTGHIPVNTLLIRESKRRVSVKDVSERIEEAPSEGITSGR